jgi:hypothetical protein
MTTKFSLTEILANDKTLEYAVISHRWGPPGDKALYDYTIKGADKEKRGYRKG